MLFNLRKLGGAALIGLAAFLFFIFVLPQYLSVKSIQAAISDREEVISEKKEIFKKIDLLKGQYTSKSADIERLSVLLPKSKKIEEIFVALEDLSKQSGIELRGITTGVREISRDETKKIVYVETVLAGQYPSLSNFLVLLEKNLRIFDVKELSISREASGPSGILIFKLTFETYFVE